MTAEPLEESPEEPQLPTGQSTREDQSLTASGSNVIDFPAPTLNPSQSRPGASARGPELPTGQSPGDTQSEAAGGTDFPADQASDGTQAAGVGRDQTSTSGQHGNDTQAGRAARGPILEDDFLGILAETVNDFESIRKALANRYRELTRGKVDENGKPLKLDQDGYRRGLGLSDDAPEVAIMREMLVAIGGEKQKVLDPEKYKADGTGGIEHTAVLRLNKRMRHHQLWKAWGVHQKGVGEKQLARLLGAIGDPYWNEKHGRPRKLSELWSYCGFSVDDGAAVKKKRGQKVTWSPEARMRTWNIAGKCLPAKGAYYEVYLEAKAKYMDAVHTRECVRCGPEKNPAQPGSPLNDAHKHARALRILMKEILRDLWQASKALHEAEPT